MTLDGDIISWNAVADAEEYVVYFYNKTEEYEQSEVYLEETQLDLISYAAFDDRYVTDGCEYALTVEVVGGSWNGSCSNAVTWTYQTVTDDVLESPVCYEEDGYLKWNAVAGAYTYAVDYRTVGSDTWTSWGRKTATESNLASIFESKDPGEYELSVIAINEDGTICSERSNIVTYTHA